VVVGAEVSGGGGGRGIVTVGGAGTKDIPGNSTAAYRIFNKSNLY